MTATDEYCYFLNPQSDGPEGKYYTNVFKKKNPDNVKVFATPKEDGAKLLVKVGSNDYLLNKIPNREDTLYINSEVIPGYTLFASTGLNQHGEYLRLNKTVTKTKGAAKPMSEQAVEASKFPDELKFAE